LEKPGPEGIQLLIKVSYEELATCEKLEYHLYAINGERLYKAGEELGAAKLEELNQTGLYRDANALPRIEPFIDSVDHEGHIFQFSSKTHPAVQAEAQAEAKAPNLLAPEKVKTGLLAIEEFIGRLKRGATPDIALCEVARDKLIAEVTSKVDQIQYISQVRVRDEFTYSHILDVTALAIALAIKVGFSPNEVREIALAALLHDLGKLLIPRDIMFKPSRLTEKEFNVMKLHPELGYNIIKNVLRLPDDIARPALEHQEMYGGGGYPLGLKGDEIHPYSHLVKITDVYDALTSKRPYKESIPSFKAIKIMLSEGEKSFHPDYLEHFIKLCNYHDFSREDEIPNARAAYAAG
jgi:HD-GYP domain-containing protein (c-di-GMP phosphodiesterase class II)